MFDITVVLKQRHMLARGKVSWTWWAPVVLVPDWNISGVQHLHHGEDWNILFWKHRLILSGEYGLFLNK